MPRVYMRFEVIGQTWLCEFVDDAVIPIRKLRVGTPDTIREIARRGGALKNLETRQMLEYGISSGRGGVTLDLTCEQYSKLRCVSTRYVGQILP
jgi:hypothetical protein